MKHVIIVICFCLPEMIAAQSYTREPDPERIADALYGTRQDDLDYEALYENLALYLASPLDINEATAEELQLLKILTDAQVQSILAYRTATGYLLSVYELQAIPGLDAAACTRLAPFITVVEPTVLTTLPGKPVHQEMEGYVLFRYEQTLEQQAGFTAGEPERRFRGARGKRYLRARLHNNGFRAGLTAENDAGEAMAWKPRNHQYGFDYVSAYAQVVRQGRIQNLIAGDYQAQFGQGLIMGGLLGMGKGSEAVATVRQPGVGFTPWSSAFEATYRRGVAATIGLGRKTGISLFGSRTRRDASTANDSLNNTLRAWQTSGLHRNTLELASRRHAIEQNYGTVLHYKGTTLDAGLIVDHLRFSRRLEPRSTVYNPFAFQGNSNTNTSLYINYSINNLSFFSELAHTVGRGWAGIAGVVASLTTRLDVALLYRKFDSDYHAQYSSAFAEGATTQNETGVYWGWKYTFGRKLDISGYVDLFRFPWLRYRVYAPSGGHEWLARLNYQPSKTVKGWLQVRETQKARNTSRETTLYTITPTLMRQYKTGVAYEAAILKLKSQVQFCTFRAEGHTAVGSAIMQDIQVKAGRLKCTARYALFDTDTYDTRIYAYENDVWLAYSLPVYAGKGVRRYVVLEYPVRRNVTVWLRYANTRYTDRNETGSGLDRIAGNVRNDIKFEVRATF